MSGGMTIAPLVEYDRTGTVVDGDTIMQAHVICMYVPSFGTLFLIEKVGVLRIMALGMVVEIIGVGFFFYQTFQGVMISLIFIGVGWNFAFVGATTLISHTYFPLEKFKAQTLNDTIIFSCTALMLVCVGYVYDIVGWLPITGVGFILLASATIILFLFMKFNKGELAPPPVAAPALHEDDPDLGAMLLSPSRRAVDSAAPPSDHRYDAPRVPPMAFLARAQSSPASVGS